MRQQTCRLGLDLNQEQDTLLNHKNIADTLTNAYSMLENEDFQVWPMFVQPWMTWKVSKYDPEYREEFQALCHRTYYVLNISKRLEAIIEDLDFGGNHNCGVENRLDLLHTITRKYGGYWWCLLFCQDYGKIQSLDRRNLSSEDMEAELKLEVNLVNLWSACFCSS